jgi:hypothetical protein
LKANFAVRDLDVFEHDHGVRAFRESCAGHDLERGAGFEWFGTRRFTGAEDARDGNPVAGGECSTLDGVAITGGAMKWWEVAVGTDRRGDNALERFEEREVLGFPRFGSESLGVLEDEAGGFGIREDHPFIVRLRAFGLQPPRLR